MERGARPLMLVAAIYPGPLPSLRLPVVAELRGKVATIRRGDTFPCLKQQQQPAPGFLARPGRARRGGRGAPQGVRGLIRGLMALPTVAAVQ